MRRTPAVSISIFIIIVNLSLFHSQHFGNCMEWCDSGGSSVAIGVITVSCVFSPLLLPLIGFCHLVGTAQPLKERKKETNFKEILRVFVFKGGGGKNYLKRNISCSLITPPAPLIGCCHPACTTAIKHIDDRPNGLHQILCNRSIT